MAAKVPLRRRRRVGGSRSGAGEVWRTWGGVCLVQGGAGRAGRASHRSSPTVELWRTRRLYSLAPSRSHPSLSLRPEAGRSLMALAHDLEQPSAHLPDAACSLPVASHRLTISRAPSLHPYPMSLFRPLPCRILYCQFPRQ